MPFAHAGFYGTDNMLTASGAPLRAGTAVSVFVPGTATLAVIYSDADRSSVVANPVLTGAFGNLSFYAEAGAYEIDAGYGRVRVVAAPDPADLDGAGPGPGPSGGAPHGNRTIILYNPDDGPLELPAAVPAEIVQSVHDLVELDDGKAVYALLNASNDPVLNPARLRLPRPTTDQSPFVVAIIQPSALDCTTEANDPFVFSNRSTGGAANPSDPMVGSVTFGALQMVMDGQIAGMWNAAVENYGDGQGV